MYTEKTAAARAETQPACGEGTGQLPACGALAFPYGSMQGTDPRRYDDKEALELYWSYIRLGQEGRKRYQEKCGPLMQTDITPGSYQWLNDPWPWDGKGN